MLFRRQQSNLHIQNVPHAPGRQQQPTLYVQLFTSLRNSGRHRSPPLCISTQTIYDISIASNLFIYLNSKSS